MPRKLKPITQLEAECIVWNSKCPVGTIVQYRPVLGRPEYRLRSTSSHAYVLSGHTAVVFLKEESGCVALDNCTLVIPEGSDAA